MLTYGEVKAISESALIAERLTAIGDEISATTTNMAVEKGAVSPENMARYWEFCFASGLKRIDAFTNFALASHLASCTPEVMFTYVKFERGQVNKGLKAKKIALEYLGRHKHG